MKIISCHHCAVMLDQDKLDFPNSMYNDDDEIDEKKADWNQEAKTFQVYLECPVCKEKIFKED